MSRPALLSLRSKFTEPTGCRYSAIHEEVAAVDKHAVKTHEECSKFLLRPGVPASSSRRYFEYAPFSRGVMMMPGLIVVDPRAALSSTVYLDRQEQRVPPL